MSSVFLGLRKPTFHELNATNMSVFLGLRKPTFYELNATNGIFRKYASNGNANNNE